MPEVDVVTSWYMDTFFMLSSSRQISQGGLSPIPLSEVTSYANNFGHIEDDLKSFCHIIAEVDSAYLKYVNTKNS